MINLTIYLVPYCEENILRIRHKRFTTVEDCTNRCIFNCLLNDSNDDNCLLLMVKLFQAVGPAVQNARSPNMVSVYRVGGVAM